MSFAYNGSQQYKIMKQNTLSAKKFESTYALIVRSEEKERNIFEGAAFLVFILSAIFSIWHVAQQPIELPVGGIIHTASAGSTSPTPQRA